MNYGEDEFGCFCLFTICMEIIVNIYLVLFHFHKHLLSLFVTSSAGLRFYYLWVWFISKELYMEKIGFLHILVYIGATLLVLSYICRLAFRYWIYPDMFYEHRRLYSEYFDFWYASIFSPSGLGEDSDHTDWFGGSVLLLLQHIDCLWDYALAGIINAVVFTGFLLSCIVVVLGYIGSNVIFLLVAHLLLALFLAYPGLVVAELLIALIFHHSSESGEFRFFLLRTFLFKLDNYMRFVFRVEMDVMGWVELKSQYFYLCQLVYFLLVYVCTGSWAFVLLEDELPAVRVDLDVKLQPDLLRMMGLEVVLASLSGMFVSMSAGAATGAVLPLILLLSSVVGMWAQLLVLWRNNRRKQIMVTVRHNPKNYVVDVDEMEGSSEGDEESSGGGEAGHNADNDDDEDDY